MKRYIIRRERRELRHRIRHIRPRFTRQADDDVHIDRRYARRPQIMVHRHNILRRVTAPDTFQRPLLHRLRIDADPGHVIIFQRLYLARRHTVGTSRLDSNLRDPCGIKILPDRFHQCGKKMIGQARRRPAANINTLYPQIVTRKGGANRPHVLFQNLHKIC